MFFATRDEIVAERALHRRAMSVDVSVCARLAYSKVNEVVAQLLAVSLIYFDVVGA